MQRGESTAVARDDEREFVRAATPLSPELTASLLARCPCHEGILLAAASGFTQYSIDMVHLGVIFLVNLARGFRQPLVGVNLFLASIDSLAAGAAGPLAR